MGIKETSRRGIFAVVGCEISITRVPEADPIIEAGLITDSIVATSASRNLFLFALKRSRRIYYAARSSALLVLALTDTFPRVTASRHIVLSRGHPVQFSLPRLVSRLFFASFIPSASVVRLPSALAHAPLLG